MYYEFLIKTIYIAPFPLPIEWPISFFVIEQYEYYMWEIDS